MTDLVKKLRGKSLKDSLNDEEVAKAILKVMVKSKKWQEHAKQHANAELVILSTPGLDTHFEKKDEKNLPSLLINLGERRISNEEFKAETSVKDLPKSEPAFVYGSQGEAAAFFYGSRAAEKSPFSYNNLKGSAFIYQSGSDPEQMVVAGCPCGFLLQAAATNGKVAEQHLQTHKSSGLSFSYRPGTSLTDSYGPQNVGAAGYGTNISYGNSSVSGYGKSMFERENEHGTGF